MSINPMKLPVAYDARRLSANGWAAGVLGPNHLFVRHAAASG